MNLAIITNKPFENCETFVKAQIELLPFQTTHYWGRKFPFNVPVPKRKKGLSQRVKQKIKPEKKVTRLELFCQDLEAKAIDVVLAEYGVMGADVLSACERLQLPLVVHFHGYDAVRHTTLEAYKDKYEKLFSYAKTSVVSVSNEMTKRLIAAGCPSEKITYNTYGPADTFLQLTPTYSKDQFVSIGRFVEKKAPHLSILAFHEFLKQGSDAHFVFAGDGPLLDSCKDLAIALGIDTKVLFPGRITPAQYQQYLQESIAYVQHSVEAQDGDMEGTPVSILEASGAGLPIVSTFHAGIPDVILHEETGLLCEERDYLQMTKHLKWIYENKDAAKEMGQKGKQRISNKYSRTIHIDGLAKIIKQSVQG